MDNPDSSLAEVAREWRGTSCVHLATHLTLTLTDRIDEWLPACRPRRPPSAEACSPPACLAAAGEFFDSIYYPV